MSSKITFFRPYPPQLELLLKYEKFETILQFRLFYNTENVKLFSDPVR